MKIYRDQVPLLVPARTHARTHALLLCLARFRFPALTHVRFSVTTVGINTERRVLSALTRRLRCCLKTHVRVSGTRIVDNETKRRLYYANVRGRQECREILTFGSEKSQITSQSAYVTMFVHSHRNFPGFSQNRSRVVCQI